MSGTSSGRGFLPRPHAELPQFVRLTVVDPPEMAIAGGRVPLTARLTNISSQTLTITHRAGIFASYLDADADVPVGGGDQWMVALAKTAALAPGESARLLGSIAASRLAEPRHPRGEPLLPLAPGIYRLLAFCQVTLTALDMRGHLLSRTYPVTVVDASLGSMP